jgi:hypothetical protein
MSALLQSDVTPETGVIPLAPPNQRQLSSTRKRLSGPAIRAFFNIADRWALTNDEQQALLGWPARATFFKIKKGNVSTLSFDTLERISLILGIYKALHILFADDALADQWVKLRNTNPLFGGTPAIQFMTQSIDHLYQVRRLLDSRRGTAS